MKILQWVSFHLVSAHSFTATTVHIPVVLLTRPSISMNEIDYSPCKYHQQRIDCVNANAPQVLDAFHRNENNTDIRSLYVQNVVDMTDDILEEMVNIIASAAYDNIQTISVDSLGLIERVPAIIQHLPDLQLLYLMYNEGMTILPAGSLNFSSNSLKTIDCSFCNIGVVEIGAFHGNFDGTEIYLTNNNLTKFDEQVFKPLLTDWNATIYFDGNPIHCDCDLSWLIRDNRHLMQRVGGDCLNDENGTRIDFRNIDANMLIYCSGGPSINITPSNKELILIALVLIVNYCNHV